MFALPPRDDQVRIEWNLMCLVWNGACVMLQPGAWMPPTPEAPREKAMRTLVEMGFWDIELNNSLLNRYNNDVGQVISELIQ